MNRADDYLQKVIATAQVWDGNGEALILHGRGRQDHIVLQSGMFRNQTEEGGEVLKSVVQYERKIQQAHL